MTAVPPGGLARRVAGFAGIPFLSLVIPFLFLPLLARVAGPESWLAIAVGQSTGAFAALVISLGVNTVGPTAVARAAEAERPALLRDSLRARLVLFPPVTVAAVAVAALLAPAGHALDASLMAVALALSGLASTWFLVGVGRPALIVLVELLPRAAATAAAAALLVATGVVTWYPALLIVAAVAGTGGYLARALRGASRVPPRPVRAVLRENLSATAIELAGGAYNSLAVSFVGAVAPVASAAVYVSGDKLYRMGQYAASALGNATQGWVVAAGDDQFPARARRALGVHAVLGAAGLGAFALLGPLLSGVLFGAEVAIDEATALGFGVAALAISMGTGLGRVVLVALGARREFLVCVLVGAATGVPAILVLGALYGAPGGAWGLALGELASTTLQAIFAARRWPRSAAASA